ncbi:response regulator [Phreatobacter stygius]|uniref:Response regulator transcription factor n=1 Tax=Phreatobacter stygius TaxID=1940610 RepID=A0A4D7BC68_9HYPH|nr:response regulator transcription factor [Phreatobacter stygius]QCI65587.1 response regulator transcription factor [Phreatobacter stygius]
MKRPFTVVLADDHAIVREGLKLLLSTVDDVVIAGEAADGEGVFTALKQGSIDLLVLDLGMPGVTGLQFIRSLRESFGRLKILVLTANFEPRMVRAAIEAGVDGYLTKHDDPAELVRAIDAIRQGETYLATAIRFATDDGSGPRAAGEPLADALSPIALTRRERQILALVAHGATARDMAERLGISPLTARKHRENLMRKLDLHSAAELTAFAVRLGLPAG